MVKKSPTKTRTKSAKKKLMHRINTYNFFIILAIIFGMMAGILMVKVFYKGEPFVQPKPEVTVGAIEYDIKDGKATKRKLPALTSLKSFLESKAKNDCPVSHFDEPAEYSVIAANSDVSQVLLGYGCGDLSARMFAVRDDNEWRFISPTNQFDILTNVPSCTMVTDYNISKAIAPLCYKEIKDKLRYVVR